MLDTISNYTEKTGLPRSLLLDFMILLISDGVIPISEVLTDMISIAQYQDFAK